MNDTGIYSGIVTPLCNETQSGGVPEIHRTYYYSISLGNLGEGKKVNWTTHVPIALAES